VLSVELFLTFDFIAGLDVFVYIVQNTEHKVDGGNQILRQRMAYLPVHLVLNTLVLKLIRVCDVINNHQSFSATLCFVCIVLLPCKYFDLHDEAFPLFFIPWIGLDDKKLVFCWINVW
jgi:hypothetical protein